MEPCRRGTVNFHATYDNVKLIFECNKSEVAKQIATRFGINIEDVILYAVDKDDNRQVVTPNTVSDLMKLEVVSKTSQDKAWAASMELIKKTEAIKAKLRHNTPLTGQERQMLLEAIITHNTALFHKRKLNQTDIVQPTIETSNKKIQVDISSDNKPEGTQTDLQFNNDDLNNEEDDINTLKRMWNSGEAINPEEVEYLMTKTYDARRNFIVVKCPPLKVVKEHYPALFCVDQVKNELDRIFYRGKCLEFLNNMQKYSKCILHYANDNIRESIERTRKSKGTLQKQYAEVVGSVIALSDVLEEELNFIHLSDHRQSSKDMYPYIDASCHSLNYLLSDDVLFRIMVEGLLLCELTDFKEALLCLMSAFFIFNIDYPESNRRTLTVIEKVYLEVNDTKDMDEKTGQTIKLLECAGKNNNFTR